MSASNSINDASRSQNHQLNAEITPHVNRWLDRTVCSLDKLTWLLGVILTITGVVLFILNALYAANLYIAAVAAISTGSAIFFLGILFNCCRVGGCLEEGNASNKKNKTDSKSMIKTEENKNEPIKPLAIELSTKNFFEERGIFGVPQSLIDEIDIWRKFRTMDNFEIILDAGFILDGPPGTGKTTIAQAIAEVLGGEYFEKKCGELNDQWHGNTEKNITDLFTVSENQFRVVVIDEISGLLPKRKNRYWTSSITDHFLGVVSGIAQKKPQYILIGTTNNFKELDPALIRRGRLGKKFTIDMPDNDTRLKIFNYHLSKISHSKDEDWTNFVESAVRSSDGCSCADIVGKISDAQKKALLADRDLRIEDFV